jgi:serine protease Do
MGSKSWVAVLVGIVVGCAGGLALAFTGTVSAPALLAQPAQVAGEPPGMQLAQATGSHGGALPEAALTDESGHSRFAILARAIAPGIVNVHTSKTVEQQMPDLGPFGDLLGPLFGGRPGGPHGPQQGPPESRRFTVPSLGTGFVIAESGLIITNYHVVENVDKIEIVFVDGTRSDAEVVGTDPKTDIALVRAKEKRSYTALPLGNSDTLLPGDWVMAVGNPFGLDHTVTAGIVSATGRDIGAGPYDDFIQTDAAINPGNSGGPLLNLAGEVVGINTAINPQANTIGFAVPINMAKEILPQLEKGQAVVRGWLGVAVQPVTSELADALKLETQRGALIAQVAPKGPASKAGLERGDVILRFGDKPIERMRELPRAVALTAPGTKVELEIVRDGKTLKKTVEVAKLVDEKPERAPGEQPAPPDDETGSTAFGFDISDGEGGAEITNVYPGGPADQAGLQKGDVIEEVDKHAVKGGLDAESKLRAAGDKVLLAVKREGGALLVVVKRPAD